MIPNSSRTFTSSVMTLADKARVVSPSSLKIITPRDTQTISRPSLTNTDSRDLLSADGTFDSDDFNPLDGDGSNPDLYIGALGVRRTLLPSSDLDI